MGFAADFHASGFIVCSRGGYLHPLDASERFLSRISGRSGSNVFQLRNAEKKMFVKKGGL
jgi:hypothetical protein